MMGDTLNSQDQAALNEQERRKRADSTHDPEFEIPDPEQVERDRQQAERLYGKDDKNKPAA